MALLPKGSPASFLLVRNLWLESWIYNKTNSTLFKAKDLTFDSEYEPFFQPPGWVIGPIWAVLYTCLAVSFTTVLDKREELNAFSFIVASFLIQLALNLAWPAVFNSERYLLSLVMLVLMIGFTLIYAYLTYKAAPLASYLVWPYLAWISFAAAINTAYYLEAR